MLAVAVFADWFARRGPREVHVGDRSDSSAPGSSCSSARAPAGQRAYVMRALDLLR